MICGRIFSVCYPKQLRIQKWGIRGSAAGGTKKISLDTIQSAEKTLIPFGIRLFGASDYGGYCYFPSFDKAFAIITNFRDGVLIEAKQGIYLITPMNPEEFIKSIKKMGKL